jgi:guanidinobutyrase
MSQAFSLLSCGSIRLSVNLQGFRVIPAHKCYHQSASPMMEEIRQMIGDGPIYVSFDIDALDPSFAPGTGKF